MRHHRRCRRSGLHDMKTLPEGRVPFFHTTRDTTEEAAQDNRRDSSNESRCRDSRPYPRSCPAVPDSEEGPGYKQGCSDHDFRREGKSLPGDKEKHHRPVVQEHELEVVRHLAPCSWMSSRREIQKAHDAANAHAQRPEGEQREPPVRWTVMLDRATCSRIVHDDQHGEH